jgi:NAD dependent epimerase/dehydratase family enzyme
MLLASQRVEPAALRAAGFAFRDPELAPALAALYGVPRLVPAG